MFRLAGFFNLENIDNGILMPYYAMDNRNAIFIQKLDHEYKILDFVPYYDVDQYTIYPYLSQVGRGKGDDGIVGVRFQGETIMFETTDMLRTWAANNTEIIYPHPLLSMQLKRITRASFSEMYLALERVAYAVFSDDNLRKRWISAEISILQKRDTILHEEKSNIDAKNGTFRGDEINLKKYGQDVILFLMDKRNYDNENWESVWRGIEAEKSVTDTLFELGFDWLSHQYARIGTDILMYPYVIIRLVQTQYLKPEPISDFVYFLGDLFCDNFSEVIESGFPVKFHKMAMELAFQAMEFQAKLDCLSAAFYFFSDDAKENRFFIDLLVKTLLDPIDSSPLPDYVLKNVDSIIDILGTASRYKGIANDDVDFLLDQYADIKKKHEMNFLI